MAEDRLITVAIHTYDHAVALKALLESEGVKAVLQNVNLSTPVVSSGVRVRIMESDLPKALRIIENRDIFILPPSDVDHRSEHMILVPVDFADHSLKAIDIAFNLAKRQGCRIVLLNAYLDPDVAMPAQLSDSMSYDYEVPDAIMSQEIDAEMRRTMDGFARKLRERIKSAELPAVKFTTEVLEGLPEEVISTYAKEHNPALIVMGTRESEKKGRELVGSVTAEVLDSCRLPIITVPESVDLKRVDDVKHVVVFSNLDQEDILAMDAMYRMFSHEHLCITFVSLPDKKNLLRRKEQSLKPLIEYCREHYPRFEYNSANVNPGYVVEDFEEMHRRHHVDFIVVPNKKKNMFARLFNPSLAHRLLFHSDIPMMAIPV